MDCSDWSDEQDCGIVVIDSSNYQASFPPNSIKWRYTKIRMRISIGSIDNFNENTMSYKMKFSMNLKWFDDRLSFQNLKHVGNGSNVVTN